MVETPSTEHRQARRNLPPDLRLGDLLTFLGVHRCGSVTGAARALGSSPSQVSKAIARLEKQLQLVLLSRGAHGVTLTDGALRVLPRLEQVVSQLEHVADGEGVELRTLTLAGASWLVELFLPSVAEALPGVRFCGLELPPAMVRAHAADNYFDLGLIAGRADLPPTWHRTELGAVRLALLGRPALARRLGPSPVAVDRLRGIPFITPVYSVNGRFVEADDDCPLRFAERRLGHKVHTLRVAISLAARLDQLVFGPILAARRELEAGRLLEIPVQGWEQRETLTVACHPLKVRQHEHEGLVEAARATLRLAD